MIKVLYEDNHILVVEKPVNVPVQEDSSKDEDLLTMVKKYIKEKYHKPGNVYIGLVHRLDRPVGGVMVFARTSKSAERLSKQIREHTFEKKYLAVIEGKPPKREDRWEDLLLKDSHTNTVTVNSKGKISTLSYKVVQSNQGLSLVEIKLETGRSHQIRVQFSSRKLPLYGDQRYNKNAKVGQQIALFAQQIILRHPTTKEVLTFSLPLPVRKPFQYFT